MSQPLETYFFICLAALLAGILNSIAGGGTLLTFPALLGANVAPVWANATSTVALVPGSLAGAWGYRKEMHETRRWAWLLVGPSLVGGAVGSLLVTQLPQSYFATLVPWLILLAATLFLVQPTLVRWAGSGEHKAPSRLTLAGITFFQFLVAVYGGYFGAGIGILMLSSLGLMGISDIHRMNALKTFLAACINGVAVVIFILQGVVNWPFALAMAVTAIAGGYLGARVARLLNRQLVRWIVILIGFSLAAYFFYQQWTPAAPSVGYDSNRDAVVSRSESYPTYRAAT
jgi:uncharacterized membrane protein YfcA